MDSISTRAAFLCALLVTWLLLPLMRSLAFRLGAVDHPGARRVHGTVTPRLGGVAIFAGVCAGISLGVMLAIRAAGSTGLAWCDGLFVVVLAAGACMQVLGFVDDVRSLGAGAKLSVQVLLALLIFGAGGQIGVVEVPGVGEITLVWWASLALTVLWITAVTNAFNLIDGVNGLAAGVGLITALGVGAIAAYTGAPGALLIAAVLAGGLVSFLRTNLRPGGIFLGDSGSLFVGFMLSASTLLVARASERQLFPGAAFLLMGLPLIEVLTTVARRTLVSRAWSGGARGVVRFLRTELVHPDTSHLHHTLIRCGVTAGSTAGLLVAAAGAFAACSVALFVAPAQAGASLIGCGVLTIVCCGVAVRATIGMARGEGRRTAMRTGLGVVVAEIRPAKPRRAPGSTTPADDQEPTSIAA